MELLVSSTSIHLPPTLRNESKLIQIDKHAVDQRNSQLRVLYRWHFSLALVDPCGRSRASDCEVSLTRPMARCGCFNQHKHKEHQGNDGNVCRCLQFTDVYSYSAATNRNSFPPVKPQAAPPMAQRPVRSFTSDAPETQVALHRVEGMMACSGGCVP